LSGFEVSPLFGVFEWSIFGHTKYCYALGWLLISFIVMKRIVASPLGVALQGIRENQSRMRLLGNSVVAHLSIAYSIGAFFAGVAGAISAQTTAFVGISVMSLDLTFDGLVMVVLGGIGTLYGALIGTPVFMIIRHFAQGVSPYYWMFAIGALLIIVMRFTRGGLMGFCSQILTPGSRRRRA
jgi:branched-chain amino acid transport system permease protein